MSDSYAKRFADDIRDRLTQALANGLSNPNGLIKQITEDMLANNPFNPPKGCPVHNLPNELLAHIFYLGLKIEEEEAQEGDGDSEDDEDLDHDQMDLLDDEWETEDEAESEDESPPGAYKPRGSRQSSQPTESGADGDEEASQPQQPSFPVLVSHVCKRWREVSTSTPSLWSAISCDYDTRLSQVVAYTERSKSLPIDIRIDCVGPEDWTGDEVPPSPVPGGFPPDVVMVYGSPNDSDDEDELIPEPPVLSDKDVSCILDVLVHEIHRWRTFEVQATMYRSIFRILERLSTCPSAPILEGLSFYHYEDCEDYDTFHPEEYKKAFQIFNGELPSLKSVAFWGVHVDWDSCISFFHNLKELELAYHALDVRPSYATFSRMISSPSLEVLSLCLSSPAGTPRQDWDIIPFDLSSLKSLVLCHHDSPSIEALYPLLYVPNVVDLTVDFDTGDYTNFAHMLAKPSAGLPKSLLSQLQTLKIGSLTCDDKSKEVLLEQLSNLETLNLNCFGDEDLILDLLMKTKTGEAEARGSSKMVYCPNLKSLWTIGVDGKRMLEVVKARQKGGSPIDTVMMSVRDEVESDDEEELKKAVTTFDFFEPSDSDTEEDPIEDNSSDDDNL